MAGPHAVLQEGGLAHCLHSMLTHQPLDALVAMPALLEAQLKLLNAVLLAVPLQVRSPVLPVFSSFSVCETQKVVHKYCEVCWERLS